MTKYILGIHNNTEASVCLMRNSEILEAISEERLNLIKVYSGKPVMALDYLFKKYNKIDRPLYSTIS